VFIVTKVKEITEASTSVGLLLATAVVRSHLIFRLVRASCAVSKSIKLAFFVPL